MLEDKTIKLLHLPMAEDSWCVHKGFNNGRFLINIYDPALVDIYSTAFEEYF